MTLGLGGLGDYGGSLLSPSSSTAVSASNSNAALDLLLGPAGRANGSEPVPANKDYFKSKSGLLIRL